MVVGLDLFKEHFKGYENHYVLIGGTACDLAMDAVGETFRGTKDLDIVLCLESLTPDFISLFWAFVKKGGYDTRQKSTGKRLFYRFHSPAIEAYPFMLELFSRIPDALDYKGEGHLTPIPAEDGVSSLSAILLNDDYFYFLQAGRMEIDGISVLRPEYIIPLKARAWLDLTARKNTGERVDNKTIAKHKSDIFRLFPILEPDEVPHLRGLVAEDLLAFAEAIASTQDFSLKSLGYPRTTTSSAIIAAIKDAYGI